MCYKMSSINLVATLGRMYKSEAERFIEAMPIEELESLCKSYRFVNCKELLDYIDCFRQNLNPPEDNGCM